MLQELIRPLTACLLLSMLAACGGGGGGGSIASSPPPVTGPTPTPAPATSPTAVTIFGNPVPQTYASMGVHTDQAGNGYESVPQDGRLTSAVFDPAL